MDRPALLLVVPHPPHQKIDGAEPTPKRRRSNRQKAQSGETDNGSDRIVPVADTTTYRIVVSSPPRILEFVHTGSLAQVDKEDQCGQCQTGGTACYLPITPIRWACLECSLARRKCSRRDLTNKMDLPTGESTGSLPHLTPSDRPNISGSHQSTDDRIR